MKVKYTITFVQYGTMVHSTLKSIYKRLNSNSSNTYKKMFYNKRCYSKISCHSSSNNILFYHCIMQVHVHVNTRTWFLFQYKLYVYMFL